jgi:hypothetical protein
LAIKVPEWVVRPINDVKDLPRFGKGDFPENFPAGFFRKGLVEAAVKGYEISCRKVLRRLVKDAFRGH